MTNVTTQSNLTEKEYRDVNMFDCTVKEMDAMIALHPIYTITRTVVSMLSDVQEMMVIGESAETIRRTINRAKYMLDSLDHQER